MTGSVLRHLEDREIVFQLNSSKEQVLKGLSWRINGRKWNNCKDKNRTCFLASDLLFCFWKWSKATSREPLYAVSFKTDGQLIAITLRLVYLKELSFWTMLSVESIMFCQNFFFLSTMTVISIYCALEGQVSVHDNNTIKVSSFTSFISNLKKKFKPAKISYTRNQPLSFIGWCNWWDGGN